MNLLQLPEVILKVLFLYLSPITLHNLRQVCKTSNKQVLNLVWNSTYARKQLKKRLEHNWNTKTYRRNEIDFNLEDYGFLPVLVSSSKRFFLVGFKEHHVLGK